MTLTAIVLIIISAIVHACWNMIGKRENPSPTFFLLANTIGCFCLAPVFFMHIAVINCFSLKLWLLLGLTGLFQAIYYSGLAGAYRAGHLSVAYPLARSAPVIMVALINLLMGQGDKLSTQSIVGMGLIAVGGFLLPARSFAEWKLKDYLHASSLFAMVAAIGTSGYSIVDSEALNVLIKAAGAHAGRVSLTLIYALFEGLSSSVWLAVFVLFIKGRREEEEKPEKHQVKSAAVAGIGIYFAYTLVLLAMTFARNVSYIVAFRQLSIPIGAMLGVMVLREPHCAPKLIGVAIMLAGLVLVAI